MRRTLVLNLLGGPIIELDGAVATGFVSRKICAALFYLAVTQQQHSRQKMAALFWPEETEVTGRRNVRDLVRHLRKTVGEYVDITRSTMAIAPQAALVVDVILLETTVITLRELSEELTKKGVDFRFVRVKTKVREIMQRADLEETVPPEHFYLDVQDGVDAFLAHMQ